MTEAIISLIDRAKPDEFFALLFIFGGGAVVAIVAIIGSLVYHYRKREAEFHLKQEMIARGMSADEIERVLAATTKSSAKD